LGIVLLGGLQVLVGLKASILLCAVLFIVAMLICARVNEAQGRAAAQQWQQCQAT
jgi:UMF1 family MFS transporter